MKKTIAMEALTKSERVYTSLKERIAELPSGIRFPSIREVMREYNVSQITVDKAMNLLSEEGLIVRHPKRGIFTAASDKSDSYVRKHLLAVAVPSYPSAVYERYLEVLSTQIQRIGEMVDVIRYDWRDRIIQAVPRREIEALIIIPTSFRLTPADFFGLSQFKIPIVLISRMIRDVAIDCVEPDNVGGAELAAEHLISQGHRKLAILLPETESASVESRVDGFVRQAKLMNVDDVTILNSATKPGENSALISYEFMKNRIATKGMDFTGLFVATDLAALGAMRAFHDLNISIPGQVSVIGFGDDPESSLYHPSLSSIGCDYPEVAREAVDIIERRLSGDTEEVIQKFIPMSLVQRESTGPISA